jgi:hypothetical protein
MVLGGAVVVEVAVDVSMEVAVDVSMEVAVDVAVEVTVWVVAGAVVVTVWVEAVVVDVVAADGPEYVNRARATRALVAPDGVHDAVTLYGPPTQ